MKLEAKHLTFYYKNKEEPVLNDFSLAIDSGECVGLMAPSGHGKTTLCKILAGYEQPAKGEVLLGGKPLLAYKGYSPVQLIWQHPEQVLNPKMKMKAVLDEAGFVSERLCDRLGIAKSWLDRYPQELSGGEMQRFCIARGLGENVRFLLADEITAMLDLVTQSEIWNFLLAEAKRRNIGMLVISHDPDLLDYVCDRRIEF